MPYMLTHTSFFLCRVKLKEGVAFLGARPSNPTQWIVSQDVRSEGHRVVTLHCRRKESGYDQQRSAVECFTLKEDIKLPGSLCKVIRRYHQMFGDGDY